GEHRPDVPALGHVVGVVEGLEHHGPGRLRRQAGRRVGFRQRVRRHRGPPAGLEAGPDYEKVIQPFDMTLLLSKDIDVAEAMIYNEYAQVLEAKNPETGELYKPEDLNVINYNDEQTAMLQDALFARKSWLEQSGNEDVAVRFLEASFRGWIFCRENPDKC